MDPVARRRGDQRRRTATSPASACWAAFSRKRRRNGSSSSCFASHSSSSSSDMPWIWFESSSRIALIIFTASNVFLVLLIWQDLPRGPDLQGRVASPQVYGIVTVDPVQIDDVL